MAKDKRFDTFADYNFLLEIDGITVGAFFECTGLSTDMDSIEYREGTENYREHSQASLKKFSNITFKRGMTKNLFFWEWRKTVLDGFTERKNGIITLLNESREPVLRWSFKEAWPTKWNGPSMNATGNEMAIETLEIVHEGLELEPV